MTCWSFHVMSQVCSVVMLTMMMMMIQRKECSWWSVLLLLLLLLLLLEINWHHCCLFDWIELDSMCWNIAVVAVEENKGIIWETTTTTMMKWWWSCEIVIGSFVCWMDDLLQDITGVDMVLNHFFDFFIASKIMGCPTIVVFKINVSIVI